ncbi:MAG: hypothetical protein ACOX5K_07445 [Bacteroidales bacterium]|jgi:hypothetical protein
MKHLLKGINIKYKIQKQKIMNKIITMFLLPFVLIIATGVSCEREQEGEKIYVTDFSYSEHVYDINNTTNKISLTAIQNDRLHINHYNTINSCCGGDLFVTCELRNDTIIVVEGSTDLSCDCAAFYDMEYSLGPLNPKEYILMYYYSYKPISFIYEEGLSESYDLIILQ